MWGVGRFGRGGEWGDTNLKENWALQGQTGRLGCEDCGGERSVISPAGQQPALSKPATTSTKGAIKTITTNSTMTIDLNTQYG